MAKQDIKLPEIGEGVTEGELVDWLVQVGDTIEADQAIAELMTDKATVEVPAPTGGKVLELKFNSGDVIEVESVMMVIDTDAAGATTPAPTKEEKSEPAPAAQAPASPPQPMAAATSTPQTSGTGMDVYPPAADIKVLATPATRRLARELSVDINQISGTGLAGRVTRDDVLAKSKTGSTSATTAAPTLQSPGIPRPAYQSPGGAVEERVALKGIRKKIAENMQMAKHVIPHFTLMDEANITDLIELRKTLKPLAEQYGTKITYLPFVMKALIATVREFPMFNASIDDAAQEIVYKKYFNVGFAADTPNGLLVPVIKDADQKTILQLSQEIVDLATRARDGKLALDEMRGATFTITNIGSVGGNYATPIINHPEVAIFGMYKIQERPIVKDGELDVASFMNYTVTCDHRLIDGAVAARFLAAFIKRMENPGVLMMDMM